MSPGNDCMYTTNNTELNNPLPSNSVFSCDTTLHTHLLLISASDIIVTSLYYIMYYIFAGVSLYNG